MPGDLYIFGYFLKQLNKFSIIIPISWKMIWPRTVKHLVKNFPSNKHQSQNGNLDLMCLTSLTSLVSCFHQLNKGAQHLPWKSVIDKTLCRTQGLINLSPARIPRDSHKTGMQKPNLTWRWRSKTATSSQCAQQEVGPHSTG